MPASKVPTGGDTPIKTQTEREAEALRANLRKRKQQAQARQSAADAVAAPPGADEGKA